MAERVSPPDVPLEGAEAVKADRSGRRPWTWVAAVVSLCCVTAVLTIDSPGALLVAGGRWSQEQLGSWGAEVELAPASRFHLSPSHHSNRAPTTVTYDFVLASSLRAVDGVEKQVFTINNEFPGPTIEVRSGDMLVVNVMNNLTEESSLHWHGLRHESGTNHMDGAVGVTQCPIKPGRTFQYRFEIAPTQSGTFWYHSHHTSQRADGLFGAFIVHAPAESAAGLIHDDLRPRRSRTGAELQPRKVAPELEQVLLIGDWHHRSGEEVYNWYMSPRSRGVEPVPDSVLINGEQKFACARSRRKIICNETLGVVPRVLLDPSRSHRLRLVNTGGLANIHFSIDDHVLDVVEADGQLLDPVFLKELAIAPGQRYSVRIAPRKKGGIFWMRTRVDREDFLVPNPSLDKDSKGVLQYGRLATSLLPTTVGWTSLAAPDLLDALSLRPLREADRVLPEATGEHVMFYVTTMPRNANGMLPVGYMNQTTWVPNKKNPLLARHEPLQGPTPLGIHELVAATNRTASTVIDIIVNNLEEGPHPFHLHGHSFWPLVTHETRLGGGSYRYSHPPVLPTSAPVLRDTFVIPARGHALFRVRFDTPGIWLFHCHVLVHQAAGMAMAFDVRSQDVPAIEGEAARASCRT